MSSAVLAVSGAAKQLQVLLNNANEALDGVKQLKKGQRELEGMQSTLKQVDENQDPKVQRLLSVIEGYACNIQATVDDTDFIEFMTRSRSGCERMLFVCSYNDNIDKQGADRVVYVLKNIDGMKDASLALGLALHADSCAV